VAEAAAPALTYVNGRLRRCRHHGAMARVGIIGAGAFGSAMACVLRRSGHEVALWAREPELVDALNLQRVNPLYLQGVQLERGIAASGELGAAAAGRDFILMAVPAQHMRETAQRLRALVAPGTPVVSCAKGIERESCALMPQVLAAALPQARIAVLSGPSFAREIAAGLPCGVVLACADVELARKLSLEIRNPRFCVHPCADVTGAALGGVMKNVIGIASGIAAGRKLGENARATLVTAGLEETVRLGLAMGASRETFHGLAGIGDMMLTANSLQSRNTAFGVALGEGRNPGQALTEGVRSVAPLRVLAERLRVEMPITQALDQVLNRGAALDGVVAALLTQINGRARRGPKMT